MQWTYLSLFTGGRLPHSCVGCCGCEYVNMLSLSSCSLYIDADYWPCQAVILSTGSVHMYVCACVCVCVCVRVYVCMYVCLHCSIGYEWLLL